MTFCATLSKKEFPFKELSPKKDQKGKNPPYNEVSVDKGQKGCEYKYRIAAPKSVFIFDSQK